ncbi:MAG: abortive phage resistance protein-like [Firmicutes bacterium]|nr:abortive phage resistance protein-like [Bacillota bacterium]
MKGSDTKRRSFKRQLGELRYHRRFIVATEGRITEQTYFKGLESKANQVIVKVHCLQGKDESAPIHVLRRMKKYLQKYGLEGNDEAWLVVDKDKWTDEQLKELYDWAQNNKKYGFVLSNPMFEFWLLLHFDDGRGAADPATCLKRLEKYLPQYDKTIDMRKISKEMIIKAIEYAKRRDHPPCIDWPRQAGKTTVYRLVEKILND